MSDAERNAEKHEILNPESVFLLTPVRQPHWYAGELDPENEASMSDKIRGDLILGNLKQAIDIGYSVVLVYSNYDNQSFVESLINNANSTRGANRIIIKEQKEAGYSQARRELIRAAQGDGLCKVMLMLELEKPLLVFIPQIVKPILGGEADVTISDRGIKTKIDSESDISDEPETESEDLRGLPPIQARSERFFNNWINDYLKTKGIMPDGFPEIDWMGNRAWRNDPVLNSLFLARFGVMDNIEGLSPDYLSNTLFFPVVTMFWENIIREKAGTYQIRIKSVPIEYRHASMQTKIEVRDPRFAKKRHRQRVMLQSELVEYVNLITGLESSMFLK